MIDCMRTAKYMQERKRMCEEQRKSDCIYCSFHNRIENCIVKDIEDADINRAIRIVQGWSNASPPRTIMTELLKKYPNASIKDGVPDFCPSVLGLTLYCNGNYQSTSQACIDCWNKLVKESEVK